MSRKTAAQALLAQLAKRWPAAFAGVPLKIGIHHDILAAMPELEPRLLGLALRRHTGRSDYSAAVLTVGSSRIDLNGCPCGTVTPEEVERHQASRRREAERRRRRFMEQQKEAAEKACKPTAAG